MMAGLCRVLDKIFVLPCRKPRCCSGWEHRAPPGISTEWCGDLLAFEIINSGVFLSLCGLYEPK